MPIMQGSVSVAANAVSTNQLSGLLYEFLDQSRAVRLYCTGSAIGLNTSLLINGRAVVQDSAIGLQNRFPIVPDDFLVEDFGDGGDRLILTARNTTAGALTFFWKLEIV